MLASNRGRATLPEAVAHGDCSQPSRREEMPTFDATTLFVIAVVFLATLIRSTVGFGEALVAVPLLAFRLPVAVAAPLAVLISVLIAGLIVAQDWRHIELRSATGLIISALFGIPLGILLLTHADDHLVRTLLGIVIATFSAYSLAARSRLHLDADHRALLLGAGFLSGILGGAYGMNGPPLAIYGTLRRWSPQRFRATLQGYFLPASLVGLAGYAIAGLWVPSITRYFLLSLPGIVAGVILGRALNRRLRGDGFFKVVYAGLFVIGSVLVTQGLTR
jgi:uncharacterized protein